MKLQTTDSQIRKKKALQLEQTSSSNNFLTPLQNEEETALAHMIRNILKEELQAHQMVLQEIVRIVRSYLKITNKQSEKLSGEASDITESLEFTQKDLKIKQR